MSFQLRPVSDQTIVITGATSGIGLVTARQAAKLGARLGLVARNEDALDHLTRELREKGGEAVYAVADVASEDAVQAAATKIVSQYGGFDTWVNNAGVSIYGRLEDVDVADSRQLFETNFWGVVNGSIVAARHLRQRGGAIVNVGSTLSDRAVPIQGMYCASKHAVKGFTDALRMELEADGAPISVTLIKPAAIDTPYKEHAKNYLPVQPENPPPVYAPEVVAEAILHCAENKVRDLFAGGGGKALSMMGNYIPRTTDLVMENTMIEVQKSDRPYDGNGRESLYESRDGRLAERGGYDGHVSESSLYTQASIHPIITGAAVAVGVGGVALAIARSRKGREAAD